MRRYLTLDAMRGVAAIAVFGMHAGAMTTPFSVSHAYLAVDLFFLISGVVIDRVYGLRIQAGLTPFQFVINRYIRFYPLYLVGAGIGIVSALISFIFGQGVLNTRQFLLATATALVMAPSPTSAADSFVVPFNYAAWSLIFELFVNALYAGVYRWINIRVLSIIIAVAGVSLTVASFKAGGVGMGGEWSTFWGGVPRVIFSFTTGVFIGRIYAGEARQTPWAYALAFAPIALFVPM